MVVFKSLTREWINEVLPACRKGTDTVTHRPCLAECVFKNSFKNRKACMYVNDRKLRRIRTKVSDRIGIQSFLDRHLVKTSKMRFNRLKISFEKEQNLTSQSCENTVIFENLNTILFQKIDGVD